MVLFLHQIHLLYPFQYINKPDQSDESITEDQLFEFLPYVKTFFTAGHKNIIIKKLDIPKSGTLHFGSGTNARMAELNISDSKVFFFSHDVAILSIQIIIDTEMSKQDVSLIIKHFSNLTKTSKSRVLNVHPSKMLTEIHYDKNIRKECYEYVTVVSVENQNKTLVKDFRCTSKTIVPSQAIADAIVENRDKFQALLESAPSVNEWIEGIISPYIHSFSVSNFLNIAYLNLFVLTLIDKEDKEREKFIDTVLLRYEFSKSETTSINHSGIQKLHYSNNINAYANLNGTVVLADNNEYNKSTFFNHFGKNILLIYLFVLLQKSILIKLIDGADDELKNSQNLVNTNYKDMIIDYIRHIDFTQLSNNPVRNGIYKFYRSTYMIKDLLAEIKVIIEYYTAQKKMEDDQRAESAFRRFEIIVGSVGLLLAILGFKSEIYQCYTYLKNIF